MTKYNSSEDIQVGDIEITIYDCDDEYIIDIKDENGELIEGRTLPKTKE